MLHHQSKTYIDWCQQLLFLIKERKKSNRDIFNAFELNLHIAVLWKAVEFEFWNHLDLLWKSMGKVKCNLKLCPSWNKLKKWNFQFESFVNKCYHLAWDDVYLSHMHPVVLLFFYWRICCRSGDYLPSPPGFPKKNQ